MAVTFRLIVGLLLSSKFQMIVLSHIWARRRGAYSLARSCFKHNKEGCFSLQVGKINNARGFIMAALKAWGLSECECEHECR